MGPMWLLEHLRPRGRDDRLGFWERRLECRLQQKGFDLAQQFAGVLPARQQVQLVRRIQRVRLAVGVIFLGPGRLTANSNACSDYEFGGGGLSTPMHLHELPGHAAAQKRPSRNGLLRGVRPNEGYADTRIERQSGDRLVLYTDGIPEASNAAGELFSEERLAGFIAATKTSRRMLSPVRFLPRWPGRQAAELAPCKPTTSRW
jgi:Stage II sporulation protein E (SpoIIE)